MKLKFLALVFIAFATLVSCTTYRYEYVAPQTESGRSCAIQCLNTKQACYNTMLSQSQNNTYQCQQNNHYSYQACIAHAQTKDDVKKCNPNPQYCQSTANYWQCDETYRQCFSTCGGTVNVFKNE